MQKKFLSLGIFLTLMSFSAAPALAGFQWVQPGQPAKDANLTPAPAVDLPMDAPISVQPLPPPGAPVVAVPVPPPSNVLVAPAGAIKTLPVAAPPPAQPVVQPLPVVAPAMNIQPVPAPAPQPRLRVRTIEAPPPIPAPLPPAQTSASDITWNPAPLKASVESGSALVNESREYEARILEKPQQIAPLPTPEQMRGEPLAPPVIGLEQSPVSRKLVINPYPQNAAAAQMQMDTAPMPVPQNIVATPIASSEPNMNLVVGFGSDMPLALALQQIAPQGYTFSFGENVNPGVKVSWEGGNKPWMQVISETIAPLGLEAQLNDRVVHIRNNAPVFVPQQQGAAEIPPAMPPEQPTARLTKGWQRGNITDPGEEISAQPLDAITEAQSGALPPPADRT